MTTPTTTTRADAEIARFIERRSQGRDPDQERQEMYEASVERHNARIEAERRAEWIRYHERQAEALESFAAALAAQHRARADKLRGEGSP